MNVSKLVETLNSEGISVSEAQIRNWEDANLINCDRDDNNFRDFKDNHLDRVRACGIMSTLGISQEKIKELFNNPSNMQLIALGSLTNQIKYNVSRLEELIAKGVFNSL